MINKKHPKEFIGQRLDIVRSTNQDLARVAGAIVDETKYTFVVHQAGRNKRIQKQGSVFRIGSSVLHGKDLLQRPHERI